MSLRALPSVDRVLNMEGTGRLVANYGRSLTVAAIRETMDYMRSRIQDGNPPPEEVEILSKTQQVLESWSAPTLRAVINATGVIIHTNLGRAPLSQEARQAVQAIASGYSTLEYNLSEGVRGKREVHAESLLLRLTEAEAALVVNNNAAAVLLALTALAAGKEVLISRSQLIEIGGGFRIPDVLNQSGAKLVEVGTTNRTHLRDFESAINERTGLILFAHHSNFKIVGFTTEPTLEELVELGKRNTIPVVHDLGSGALYDTERFGLGHEPTVQESLGIGVPIIAFSGDKLLGGPQAGILLGDKGIIDILRQHPLARAVRPDKLCLAALGATLRHYLFGEALEKVPIWRMISSSAVALKDRAMSWRERLGVGEVVQGRSTVGGGSLPEETLPTWLFSLSTEKPNATADQLRQGEIPVIARVEKDRVILDPRTVLPDQDQDLLRMIGELEGI